MSDLTPRRGCVLVRPISTQETLPGGRILIPDASREAYAAYQVDILAVGAEEICDDADCEREHWRQIAAEAVPDGINDCVERIHPIDPRIKPGAWAIVSPRSYVDACHETEKRYIVKVEDIVAILGEAE